MRAAPARSTGALRCHRALIGLCLAFELVSGFLSRLDAAEEPPSHLLDGIWHWTFTMDDGLKIEPRAKLKQQGNTVTGTSAVHPGQDAPITNGVIQGDSVSWSVVREHNGRKVTTRYQGVLAGDSIRGTIESDWAGPGEVRRYAWEARRLPITPDGTWRWVAGVGRPGSGGPGARALREAHATFKVSGEKVSGKISGLGRELEIKHGRFVQGEFSFELVREREGERLTTFYRGKVRADSIRGEMESDFGRDLRPHPWIATRVEEP